MPELPEVEAARRAIEENCLGKKIKRSVVADDAKVIDGISPSDFEASLTGKTIVAAHRKGKNMWIQLDSPPFPSFQFGMAGAIYIKGVAVTKYKRSAVNEDDEWPSKYSKLFIELDDGLELSFTDKRRFAKVRLLQNPASAPPISELGPDALLEPMTEEELFKSLSKKKIGIKALILDQSFISGVGNWIADEVLYQARIHPLQSAATISKEQCGALHKFLKEVIRHSVKVNADSSRFPVDWLFHSRWGKKPGNLNGKKIEFINAGGRTSAYVPELQKLSGEQAGKEVVQGKKKSSKKSRDESEDEENVKNVKGKGGKKRSESGGKKKTPVKRKSNSSDNDDDDDGEEEKEKDEVEETNDDKRAKEKKQKGRKAGNKKPPAKKKSPESGDDSGDEFEEEEEEKKVQVKGKKGVAKKVPTGRQAKKRVK
ncbi:formamidopyrimidine-DNA glycosylase isoform X2 [Lactuca sativa]|uniref:formamidopyrimidine-DNA glycosylase isoform X2 n=1 Tax=Lactuca sativa TaxID=4236 RepID=UPI001C6897C8|nr:formamidopyrimidine-DNA glycosylase isoform X2 [Lactuca sativa]